MTSARSWTLAASALWFAACSPTLDWREFVAEGTDLTVTFPCRPERHSRIVVLAGERVPMDMMVCSTSSATFALSVVSVPDPARMASTLKNLRDASIANVRGGSPLVGPLAIRGMTPNEQAAKLTLNGKLPDGAEIKEYFAVFARGLRAYQATIIGSAPEPGAVEVFFGALRFSP